MRRLSAAALVLWSLVASAALADAQTLPRPTSKVSDFAGLLTPAARADLEALLTTLEKDTTAEVVVATKASLGGTSVEDYGNRVFNEWQIGKAALDNGVLVLVAPTERQIRIEVGYGLEGVIPDGLACLYRSAGPVGAMPPNVDSRVSSNVNVRLPSSGTNIVPRMRFAFSMVPFMRSPPSPKLTSITT